MTVVLLVSVVAFFLLTLIGYELRCHDFKLRWRNAKRQRDVLYRMYGVDDILPSNEEMKVFQEVSEEINGTPQENLKEKKDDKLV